MEKWQGHTLSMSEEWILVCTCSGANSCKDFGVGDYGYVCWIKWARLLSLLKKIGRQDRSEDLSHYGIQSNDKFNSISNEKSSWMKFKKPDRSLSIRSPSNACQIVAVGVYHPHAATFVMATKLPSILWHVWRPDEWFHRGLCLVPLVLVAVASLLEG